MATCRVKYAAMAVLLFGLAINGILTKTANGQSVCNMSREGLLACRPSVTPPNPAPPSANCCSALSRANLQCLCGYKNSPILPPLQVDPKLAMQLPEKCKIPHPAHC